MDPTANFYVKVGELYSYEVLSTPPRVASEAVVLRFDWMESLLVPSRFVQCSIVVIEEQVVLHWSITCFAICLFSALLTSREMLVT